MLDKLGLIGWSSIEPVTIAALAANEPILFIGNQGTNKTEGPGVIAKGILGAESRYVAYDTSLIAIDDLLGYPNPKSMAEGHIEYMGTEVSVWQVDAAGFDEINRVNPMTSAKIMELIRTRRVMGRQTSLKMVFAMCNPPGGDYDTIFMDVATVSRFAVTAVPNSSKLNNKELVKIMISDDDVLKRAPNLEDFRANFSKIRDTEFSPDQKKQVAEMIAKAVKLVMAKVAIEPRQTKSILKMLLAAEAMSKLGLRAISSNDKVDIIISKIPQAHGITRSTVKDLASVRSQLLQIVSGYEIGDPMITSTSAVAMVEMATISDINAWAATTQRLLAQEDDVDKLRHIGKKLTTRLQNKDISPSVYNAVMQNAVASWIRTGGMAGNGARLTWDRAEVRKDIRNFMGA